MNTVQMSKGNTPAGNIVLRREGNKLDVFYGQDGWAPWARFNLKKTQKGIFLEHVAGDKVPGFVMKHLISTFNQ